MAETYGFIAPVSKSAVQYISSCRIHLCPGSAAHVTAHHPMVIFVIVPNLFNSLRTLEGLQALKALQMTLSLAA